MILKLKKEKSSNIRYATYNKRKKRARVCYKSSPQKVYAYLAVTQDEADAVKNADSRGSAINKILKKNHEFIVLKDG